MLIFLVFSFAPFFASANDHTCAVKTRNFADIISKFHTQPDARFAEILEAGYITTKSTIKGQLASKYLAEKYLSSYDKKVELRKNYYDVQLEYANAYYGDRLQKKSFYDGTVDPIPSRTIAQNTKVVNLIETTPDISKERYLEEVRKIYGISASVEPDMDKSLLAAERLWESNSQIKKLQAKAEVLGNSKLYQELAQDGYLPKKATFDPMEGDGHPTKVDRSNLAMQKKFDAEVEKPGAIKSFASKLNPETYGLVGGLAAGTVGALAGAYAIEKISHGECGLTMTPDQAHNFSRFAEFSLLQGCSITPQAAEALAQGTDSELEKVCHDIPQLDGIMANMVSRHFDSIKRFASPIDVDIQCDGKSLKQVSFGMRDTVRKYSITPASGKMLVELNDPSYPYGIKDHLNKVNYSVAFDADKQAWGTVQSEGVYSSNLSDLHGMDAKDFQGYRLRHPTFSDIVEERKKNVIAESLDNATVMVPAAQKFCSENGTGVGTTAPLEKGEK